MMRVSSVALVVLVLGVAHTSAKITADFSDASWERPITKVIGMLKDMATQLEKEADADEEMYEKLGCWCETNDKEKTKAIADENQKITDLTAAVEEYTAKDSQLTTEIEKLNADIAKLTGALAEATTIRTKEAGEFAAEEKDMMSNAEMLKGAVEKLGAAHGSAAALSQSSLMQIRGVLRRHMERHNAMFNEKLSHEQHRTVLALLQEDKSALSYVPQSGAIFGILKQMKEEFETNIANGQKEEAQAQAEYGGMKSAKTDQINAATDLAKSKTIELGNTKED